jgi:hypothetical protein
VRLLIDPVLIEYYSVTPIILVVLGAAVSVAQRRALPFVLCLIMMNLLVDAPLGLVTAVILVVLVAITTVVVVRGGRAETSGRQVVPKIDIPAI